MAVNRESLWNSGHDESVEVNQRALIDKVLARYSGEFTVFRELLQNSDDAASKSVEIHFDTQAYLDRRKAGVPEDENWKLPDLKTEPVHQWTFKNNGIVFRDEDWSRLKKIAEGNPDEEKIGAFGVGFYSLFSITEEPFVTSGDQWMGFYWKDKKDQLYARRGTLPSSSTPEERLWTSFEMPLREPAPIPVAFDLTRFLASSITFMVHMREVSVFLDGRRLARLTKDPGHPVNVLLPRGLKTSSPSNTMHVSGIKQTPLYIEAEVARCVYTSGTSKPVSTLIQAASKALKPSAVSTGFFSSLFSSFASPSPTPRRALTPAPPSAPVKEIDPLTINKSSVVLHVFSAEVSVRLDKKMISELQRSTKKNPPSSLRLDLIYTGKSEFDASKQEDEKFDQPTGSVFQGLRADLDGTGSARVFIGHATGQTTGLGGHISARFIPTVERESIDLVDRNVAIWNKELLYVGGFLSRAAYETEMANIKQLWLASAESGTVDEQVRSWLTSRCLHALKFFTFHPSTPSSLVSSLLETSFFACAIAHPFSIMSSTGVKDAGDVRIPVATFAAFLKNLPVLPSEIVAEAQTMVDVLRARGVIKEITFSDVLGELRSRPLDETEASACMKWWISVWAAGETAHSNLPQIRQQLIDALILTLNMNTAEGQILPLSSIRSFVNLRSMGSIIPLDGPLPEQTLPISISRNFGPQDLTSAFGWQELTILEWVRYVVSPDSASKGPDFDISTSAVWAERVLNTLARAWPSLAKVHQAEVVKLLADKQCIPTRAGLKSPDQAYFPTAHIFEDLPVVTFPKGSPVKGNLEKVLDALGVRKHVDLQVVFNRMIKTGDWTIADLIKYLVAVQQTLTQVELDRLRQTSAFPRELPEGSPDADQEKTKRFKASDLYEPLDIFRELKLPVIDWGTQVKWRSSSEEAKFLHQLGLRRFPPLPVILKLASDQDPALRSSGLKYFLDNYARYTDYDPSTFKDLAYVPALAPDGKKTMGSSNQVFVDRSASLFGFLVVDPSLPDSNVDKLKLQKQPPSSQIVTVLEKNTVRDPAVAQEWFEVLAGRLADFTPYQLKHLSTLLIVPVKQADGKSIQMLAPKDCYFKRDTNQSFHSKLFVFVDFGPKANTFLSACGIKHEPSAEEIVQILLTDPKKFYNLAGGKESYLIEMKNIAVNKRLLSALIITRMKRTPFLLGSRRMKRSTEKAKSEKTVPTGDLLDLDDEEEWELQYDLMKAEQIVIADDPNAYQYFGDAVFCAPQEDLLEEFYTDLGSPRLSSLVKEEYKTSVELRDHKLSKEMRNLILERLPLFLHEHTHTRPRVQYSWLNNEKNFVVKTFGKLVVTKSLHFGSVHMSRNQDASAAAKYNSWGPIELWLAGNSQVDMYEVAISLCRALFNVPKANDALLFMTILSTDLRALKRRGYNVDRILKKQRADRDALERARQKQADEFERLLSDRQPESSPHNPPPIAGSSIDPIGQRGRELPALPNEDTVVSDSPNQRPLSSLSNQLQSWRRKLSAAPTKGEPSRPSVSNVQAIPSRPNSPDSSGNAATRPSSPEARPQSPAMPGGLPAGNLPVPRDPIARRPQSSRGQVTSLGNIESNVQQAIAACREERGDILRNREQMQMVRESLDEGYCDISGRVNDLIFAGSMSDIKVYVAKDVPNGSEILNARHDAIARFIHIIRPLRSLYKLPPTSVHIFYDLQGDSIAFNRNASIFLNLRYYEAWHDRDIQQGALSKAFISWFFTLAHEIAHNLVQPHNSEHEFYFSSICEAHVTSLARLLST